MAAPTACQERAVSHSPSATCRVGFIQHRTQKTSLGEAGGEGCRPECGLRTPRGEPRGVAVGQSMPASRRSSASTAGSSAGGRCAATAPATRSWARSIAVSAPAGRPGAERHVDGEGRAGGGRSRPAGRAAGGRQVDAGGDRRARARASRRQRHLLVAEDAAAGDHAHAGQHVDAGGQREVRGRGVVQRRLPARLLGAARVDAALGGQAVEVADVADGGGHDRVLGGAAGEVAALEVHHAGDEADEDRRARGRPPGSRRRS